MKTPYVKDSPAQFYDWKKIPEEAADRVYMYPDDTQLEVYGVQWIAVSESGSHRLVCEDGTCFYVKAGWNAITWDGGQFSF